MGQEDIPQFKQAIIDIPVVCSLCLHWLPILLKGTVILVLQ